MSICGPLSSIAIYEYYCDGQYPNGPPRVEDEKVRDQLFNGGHFIVGMSSNLRRHLYSVAEDRGETDACGGRMVYVACEPIPCPLLECHGVLRRRVVK